MSGIKLRTCLSALLLSVAGFSSAIAQETPPVKIHFPGCTDEKTVFFAWAVDHKNAVEICKVKNGYRYSYGNINKPEVRDTVTEMRAVKMYGGMLPAFVFTHNGISYWLSADKYGDADLMVTKGEWLKGTALDSIKLETEDMGYTNRVSQMLPYADTTRIDEATKK